MPLPALVSSCKLHTASLLCECIGLRFLDFDRDRDVSVLSPRSSSKLSQKMSKFSFLQGVNDTHTKKNMSGTPSPDQRTNEALLEHPNDEKASQVTFDVILDINNLPWVGEPNYRDPSIIIKFTLKRRVFLCYLNFFFPSKDNPCFYVAYTELKLLSGQMIKCCGRCRLQRRLVVIHDKRRSEDTRGDTFLYVVNFTSFSTMVLSTNLGAHT